jgi:hypothetical protein
MNAVELDEASAEWLRDLGGTGAARFTTSACKFAIFETSSRLRRHAWRQRKVEVDDTIWDRLPDASLPVLQRLEHEQLIAALHRPQRHARSRDVPIHFRPNRQGHRALPGTQRLRPVRPPRTGLRRSGWLSFDREQTDRAQVAHHPELERL